MALLTRTRPAVSWRAALLTAGLLALLLGAALAGCLQADSLGDEPPDEVAVGSPPRWDNGVGALMALKCAVCHQVPRPDASPRGVPDTFDLRYHVASPSGVAGATAILSQLSGGILRGQIPGARQMPLDYATPLTGRERTALEAWAAPAAGGP